MRKPEKASEELGEAIGSRGRIRVLKALMKGQRSGQALSISKIRAMTHLKRGNVERHVEALVNWGWVEQISILAGRKYRLKTDNQKVEALKRFFKDVGYI
jgi:DNA-binding IclR family transcriptional regulator